MILERSILLFLARIQIVQFFCVYCSNFTEGFPSEKHCASSADKLIMITGGKTPLIFVGGAWEDLMYHTIQEWPVFKEMNL